MVVLKNTEAIKEKSDKYDNKNTLNLYMTIKIPWTRIKEKYTLGKTFDKGRFPLHMKRTYKSGENMSNPTTITKIDKR